MGKKRKSGIGSFVLICLIGYIFLLFAQGVKENWSIITVFCVVVIVMYMIGIYQVDRNRKIAIELNEIQNFKKNIPIKRSECIEEIDRLRDIIIKQIGRIRVEIAWLNLGTENQATVGNVEIQSLQNILKKSEYTNLGNVWVHMYDNTQFETTNPKIFFDEKISRIPEFIMPDLDAFKSQFNVINSKSEVVTSLWLEVNMSCPLPYGTTLK